MPLAAIVPFLPGLGVAVAGAGVAQGVIGANAAGKAANAQVNAANYAANLEKQSRDDALNYQKQQDAYNRSILAPFLATGTSANMTLGNLMGLLPNYTSTNPALAPVGPPPDPSTFFSKAYDDAVAQYGAKAIQQNDSLLDPFRQRAQQDYDAAVKAQTPQAQSPVNPQTTNGYGSDAIITNPTDPNLSKAGTAGTVPGFGSLAQGFTEQFQAPGAEGLNEDPGFQARLKLGNQAIERSAAAKGNVLGGGTLKDLMSFNSDQASQEYGNVYNRRMNEYLTRANLFNQNQTNLFNRYSALSGTGQVTANELGLLGNQSAGQVGNTLLTSGAQIGQDIQNAGAARASGYVGGANAISQGIGGATNNLLSLYLLSKLGGGI